jgi:hypothetical protein
MFPWHMSPCTSGNLTVCFCGICQHTLLKMVWSVSVACQHTFLELLHSVSVQYVNTHFSIFYSSCLWHMSTDTSGASVSMECQHTLLKMIWSVSVACQQPHLELLQSVWHMQTYTSENDKICLSDISTCTSGAVVVNFFSMSICSIRLTNLKYFDPVSYLRYFPFM